MPVNFTSFVDNEIQKALPSECKRIPPDKLLGKEPYKIRHAFHTLGIGERSKLVNILVLPMSLTLNEYVEKQIIKLRDYILSRNCMLIVINEDVHANASGNTGIFIEDDLLVDCPEFLWLKCSLEKNHKSSLDYTVFEDLHEVIRSIWLGEIGYAGPKTGLQQVNLELMEDQQYVPPMLLPAAPIAIHCVETFMSGNTVCNSYTRWIVGKRDGWNTIRSHCRSTRE